MTEHKYDAMQLQLKKIFGDKDFELLQSSYTTIQIKSDTFCKEEDESEVYYQGNQPSKQMIQS